ncbi:MAG: hypothetical protein RID07_17510 [Lacipirellulaceae bacterium]
MRWKTADETPWQRFAPHRPGYAENKRLLSGTPGAKDNYELSLTHVDGAYTTPQHKHNFDQIRFMVKGDFGFDKSDELKEGSISYFPEGTPYIQRSEGDSITLLLQFGGNSGAGFLNYEVFESGLEELREVGEFKDGVFTKTKPDGGKINADSYEAVYEHVVGKKISYPKKRFERPIVVNPEVFEWVESSEEPGVMLKSVGQFGERHVGMGFIKVSKGSTHQIKPHRLVYLHEGNGEAQGHAWAQGTAAEIGPDEEVQYTAKSDSIFVYMDRPTFD